MNLGPFIPLALVLGCIVASVVTWRFAGSVKGALVAALIATPGLSLSAVLGLLWWFEGDLEGLARAMDGQGSRLAGFTALLAVPCGAAVGLVTFAARRVLCPERQASKEDST